MKLHTTTEYTVAGQERMIRARRYFEWQSRLAEPQLGRRVLEVGCGLGNFTGHLLDREIVVAMDVEPECVEILRNRYRGRPNILPVVLDALDPRLLDLRRHQLDSVACLNVLEHIEDDVLLLSRMAAILPDGGRVVLLVPAFESLYGPIDRNLGHYRRYTKRSLAAAAARAGLRPRLLRYMNIVGFAGWWVNARILKKTQQSESQIAVFDDLIVPVLSRVESWMEPPFGQSVFAVLEKAGA